MAPSDGMTVPVKLVPEWDEEALEAFAARLGQAIGRPVPVRLLPPGKAAPVARAETPVARATADSRFAGGTRVTAVTCPGCAAPDREVWVRVECGDNTGMTMDDVIDAARAKAARQCPAHAPVALCTLAGSGEETERPSETASRLSIRLPAMMASEGHQQIRTLSAAEWIEVFPGLQAKLAAAPMDPVIALFRLTPEPGRI